MSFKFLHTADWQIGKRFGRFPAETASILNHARLEAIDRIAARATEHGARAVLVAGDVFDSETLPDALVRKALSRLAAHSGIVWHLLPGNHDPARPGGLWDGLAHGLPGNVQVIVRSQPVEIDTGVVLLPAPLLAKSSSVDPTAWMSEAPSPEGSIRIGLAHGSVQGFGSQAEASIQIDPRRAHAARLDYLALGDWHGTKEIGRETWYAGTPEPDSFADNDPGHVLAVTIPAAGAPPEVARVATATYRWLARRVIVSRIEDVQPILAEIERLEPNAGRHLLDLRLEGRLAPADGSMLDRHLADLAARLLHVRHDRSRLRFSAGAADLERLQVGALRTVAQRLAAAAEQDDPQARIAAEALTRLFVLDAALDAGGAA